MPGHQTGLRSGALGADSRQPWRTCRGASVWLAVATALAIGAGHRRAAAADQLETKAEMVCNLARFVQWPAAVVTHNRGQLMVTILGEDEFAVTLASVLSTHQVNGKPVFVRFARRPRDVAGSQIVYIAASESTRTGAILTEIAGLPVLTVSDQPGFVAAGGMVGFWGEGARLQFEVAQNRAERSGLKISSRLLALCRLLDDGRQP